MGAKCSGSGSRRPEERAQGCNFGIGCLGLIVLLVIIIVAASGNKSSNNTTSSGGGGGGGGSTQTQGTCSA